MSGADFTPADGALMPPMSNGEVVFDAPWQGRVFGMARAMAETGVFGWDELRACLIEELARHDQRGGAEPFEYYEHFLRALERVLTRHGLVSAADLDRRFRAYLSRPHGHDHS